MHLPSETALDQLCQCLANEMHRLYRKVPAVETRWIVRQSTDPAQLWLVFTHQSTTLVEQGWKLHIAADPSTAIPLLKRVLVPLLLSNSSFKVIASLHHLTALNQGQYGWSQIGKYITIYPASQQEAVRLAKLLDRRTRSLSTLTIPSDRVLRAGSTVHYRYGSFHNTLSMQEPTGLISPAIRAPTGELIPDRRNHSYAVPPWCSDPFNEAGTNSELPATQRILAERYLLARVIATSLNHTLYLAGDLHNARSCVIKGPGSVWKQGAEQINQGLLHEAHILTTLSSLPQLPRLYTCIQQGTHIFLVLEDIVGESLHDYMKNMRNQGKPLEISLLLNWARQIATILKAIHAHELVYADLKPSNIIIATSGQLRLLDFELTDRWASLHIGTRGTRGYSSPARLSALPLDPTDDIYSFGALLYFMVTAADPAEAPHPTELLRRAPHWFSAAGVLLQDLIAHCLSPVPTYTAMQQVVEALDELHPPQPYTIPSISDAPGTWNQISLKLLQTLHASASHSAKQEGIFWRSSHPISYGLATRDINTGNAGTLLALSELVDAHPESSRHSLLTQAAHCMRRAPLICGQPLPGLYIGEAGVGAALLRAGQVLHDSALISAAVERGKLVASLAYQSPDLFHGTAGRLRFHLWLWDETGEREHLLHALSCGDHLLESARTNEQQETFWTIPAGYQALSGQTYLGYAHGTAGIADALLDLFETTGDQRYVNTLCAAARWLARQAVIGPDDEVAWPKREGEAVTAPFWCHGATGIGQFFLHLARHTFFAPAAELAMRAANTLSKTTLWANPTQCHGLAGNIEFLLDIYQATGEYRYREHAFSLARCLYAFEEARHGLSVFPSEDPTIYTPDYMVGYAGVAMCALRLASPEHRPRQLSRAGFRYRDIQEHTLGNVSPHKSDTYSTF